MISIKNNFNSFSTFFLLFVLFNINNVNSLLITQTRIRVRTVSPSTTVQQHQQLTQQQLLLKEPPQQQQLNITFQMSVVDPSLFRQSPLPGQLEKLKTQLNEMMENRTEKMVEIIKQQVEQGNLNITLEKIEIMPLIVPTRSWARIISRVPQGGSQARTVIVGVRRRVGNAQIGWQASRIISILAPLENIQNIINAIHSIAAQLKLQRRTPIQTNFPVTGRRVTARFLAF